MFSNINKLLLKIKNSLKLLLINILFISILFLINEPIFAKSTEVEMNLALKYCESIDRKIFKGLDNEIILKYEYFFSSLKRNAFNAKDYTLSKFLTDVEKTCSYELNREEKEEFSSLLNKFLSNK